MNKRCYASANQLCIIKFLSVYKLQNPGSRLKNKSFLLEVADYWAGMTSEETQEEDNIEATDENDDSSPPTPHAPRRDPVWRLSRNMKEHQLEANVGDGKNKYPLKPCKVCAANIKHRATRYICNTCKVLLHKGGCFTRYHIRMKY
jgi:hypothetical protein